MSNNTANWLTALRDYDVRQSVFQILAATAQDILSIDNTRIAVIFEANQDGVFVGLDADIVSGKAVFLLAKANGFAELSVDRHGPLVSRAFKAYASGNAATVTVTEILFRPSG